MRRAALVLIAVAMLVAACMMVSTADAALPPPRPTRGMHAARRAGAGAGAGARPAAPSASQATAEGMRDTDEPHSVSSELERSTDDDDDDDDDDHVDVDDDGDAARAFRWRRDALRRTVAEAFVEDAHVCRLGEARGGRACSLAVDEPYDDALAQRSVLPARAQHAHERTPPRLLQMLSGRPGRASYTRRASVGRHHEPERAWYWSRGRNVTLVRAPIGVPASTARGVRLPLWPPLSPANAPRGVTVAFWIMVPDLGDLDARRGAAAAAAGADGDGDGEWRLVLRKGDSSGAQAPAVHVSRTLVDEGGVACVRVRASFTVHSSAFQYQYMDSVSLVPLWTWVHVTVVSGRTTTGDPYVRLLLNGVEDAAGILAGHPVHNSDEFVLGPSGVWAADVGFGGLLAGVIAFDRALGDDAIEALVDDGLPHYGEPLAPPPPLLPLVLEACSATDVSGVPPDAAGGAPGVCCLRDVDTCAALSLARFLAPGSLRAWRDGVDAAWNRTADAALADALERAATRAWADSVDVPVSLRALERIVCDGTAALYAPTAVRVWAAVLLLHSGWPMWAPDAVSTLREAACLATDPSGLAAFTLAPLAMLGSVDEPSVDDARTLLALAFARGSVTAAAALTMLHQRGAYDTDANAFVVSMYGMFAAGPATADDVHVVEDIRLADDALVIESGHAGESDHIVNLEKERAHRLGDRAAMRRLGDAYYSGTNGLDVSKEQAYRYYKMASDAGDPDSMARVGSMLQKGEGVAPDNETSLELFRRAADLNSTSGLNGLGYMYYNGHIVERNYTKALEYWRRAGELGNGDGAFNAAVMLLRGEHVPINETLAFELLSRAPAHRPSVHQLIFCLLNGWGTPRDTPTAGYAFALVVNSGWWASAPSYAHKLMLARQYGSALLAYAHAAVLGFPTAAYNAAWLLHGMLVQAHDVLALSAYDALAPWALLARPVDSIVALVNASLAGPMRAGVRDGLALLSNGTWRVARDARTNAVDAPFVSIDAGASETLRLAADALAHGVDDARARTLYALLAARTLDDAESAAHLALMAAEGRGGPCSAEEVRWALGELRKLARARRPLPSGAHVLLALSDAHSGDDVRGTHAALALDRTYDLLFGSADADADASADADSDAGAEPWASLCTPTYDARAVLRELRALPDDVDAAVRRALRAQRVPRAPLCPPPSVLLADWRDAGDLDASARLHVERERVRLGADGDAVRVEAGAVRLCRTRRCWMDALSRMPARLAELALERDVAVVLALLGALLALRHYTQLRDRDLAARAALAQAAAGVGAGAGAGGGAAAVR